VAAQVMPAILVELLYSQLQMVELDMEAQAVLAA
jgi:hypothetical protein